MKTPPVSTKHDGRGRSESKKDDVAAVGIRYKTKPYKNLKNGTAKKAHLTHKTAPNRTMLTPTFHIQEEIIRRLPVKPLVRFRTISKVWKSLIDNSEFIVAHIIRHTQQQIGEVNDTIPQQTFVTTLPKFVKLPDVKKWSVALMGCFGQESILGFGVHPLTSDPKMIEIIHFTSKIMGK
ncbi:hypothetical protein LXL04_015111 [Taraxacum kok-saghyz]